MLLLFSWSGQVMYLWNCGHWWLLCTSCQIGRMGMDCLWKENWRADQSPGEKPTPVPVFLLQFPYELAGQPLRKLVSSILRTSMANYGFHNKWNSRGRLFELDSHLFLCLLTKPITRQNRTLERVCFFFCASHLNMYQVLCSLRSYESVVLRCFQFQQRKKICFFTEINAL